MRKSAYSLVEILIAAGVGLALFAVMIALFVEFSASGRLGQGRLAIQLKARQAMRRVVPLVRLASSPNTAKDGIYLPDLNLTSTNVTFSSPDDLLTPNAPAFDPRNSLYFLYQVRLDSSNRKLLLSEIYAPSRSSTLATEIADFQVKRTHPNGVILRIKTDTSVRDLRGNQKTIDYTIEEAVEVPQ